MGSIMASGSARRERNRQKAYLDRKEKQENDEYSRYSNMDWTQSAAAQNTLRKGSKQFKDAIAGARARKALGMGDDHEVDQMISGANEAMGNAIADITEQGEARAEQMRAQHKATLNQIDAARNNMQAQAAQAKIDSWNQVSNIGSQIAMNDIQSYLTSGKGMFETAFGKGKSVGTANSALSGNNNYLEWYEQQKELDRQDKFNALK